jgi:hypothetical protein
MNKDEFFADEGEIESRALLRALSIVQVIADPAQAAKKIEELSKVTADAQAASEQTAKSLAELDAKQAAMAAAEASLAERTLQMQVWIDSTEKAYREREDRIRVNEESQTAREIKLAAAEDDFARRVAAHQEQVRQMRAHLGAVA